MNALELRRVCKQFGGHRVLTEVSFDVRPGERIGIIGPNGAGKSTLFNVLSGELALSSGTIRLQGQDVSSARPYRRVQHGMARSFQLTRLLRGLTVFENVVAALHGTQVSRFQMLRSWRSARTYAALRLRGEELLRDLELWEYQDRDVATLSYGRQKRLEIAMTLALEPQVLLLDEPAAGLAAAEVPDFLAVIQRNLAGTTLLFTEHDMQVVFGLADRIIVMSGGQTLADGTPAEIRENSAVRELYLGLPQKSHA